MKSSALHRILTIAAGLLILCLGSCVHRQFDYPEPEPQNCRVILDLEYLDVEMPLYTSVDFDLNRSGNEPESRHIVKIYDIATREEAAGMIITDVGDALTLGRSFTAELPPGEYMAVCWSDFSDQGEEDRYYDTSSFPYIDLLFQKQDDGFLFHEGSTLNRNAFSGSVSFKVDESRDSRHFSVEMRRPMARFVILATDFEEFITRHGIRQAPGDDSGRSLPDYRVVFRYNGYMPSAFSIHTDAPMDSRVGAAFEGRPHPTPDGTGEIELGSDFVFCHPLDTSVELAVEVSEKTSGTVVARAGPFTVPLFRNQLTIVKGKFLTWNAGAGITIDVSFAGDYNIHL